LGGTVPLGPVRISPAAKGLNPFSFNIYHALRHDDQDED